MPHAPHTKLLTERPAQDSRKQPGLSKPTNKTTETNVLGTQHEGTTPRHQLRLLENITEHETYSCTSCNTIMLAPSSNKSPAKRDFHRAIVSQLNSEPIKRQGTAKCIYFC